MYVKEVSISNVYTCHAIACKRIWIFISARTNSPTESEWDPEQEGGATTGVSTKVKTCVFVRDVYNDSHSQHTTTLYIKSIPFACLMRKHVCFAWVALCAGSLALNAQQQQPNFVIWETRMRQLSRFAKKYTKSVHVRGKCNYTNISRSKRTKAKRLSNTNTKRQHTNTCTRVHCNMYLLYSYIGYIGILFAGIQFIQFPMKFPRSQMIWKAISFIYCVLNTLII